MARIRTIKPEFPQSESMGRISRDARLCFIQLWTIADDSGRLRGASRMLASLLFPYDDDAPGLIDGWLCELEREGCINRYEADGQHYIEVCKWLQHQKIDKPSRSFIPPFDESSRILANPREHSSEDLGPRTKDLGKEGKGEERTGAPVFSLSDELNPNKRSAIGRIEDIRNYWNNAGAMPPCRKIITNPHPDKYQSIFATLASYSDGDIQGAINNYVSITKSTSHEAFPHYGGVEGFIATGVEQYCEESKPFDRCLKKQAKPIDKPMSVEVPDSGETREFLDNLRTSARDDSFEFNAKDAMRQIRERSEA